LSSKAGGGGGAAWAQLLMHTAGQSIAIDAWDWAMVAHAHLQPEGAHEVEEGHVAVVADEPVNARLYVCPDGLVGEDLRLRHTVRVQGRKAVRDEWFGVGGNDGASRQMHSVNKRSGSRSTARIDRRQPAGARHAGEPAQPTCLSPNTCAPTPFAHTHTHTHSTHMRPP